MNNETTAIQNQLIQFPLLWNGEFMVPASPKLIQLEVIRPKKACEINSLLHSRLPLIHYSNVCRNRNYVCYGASYSGIWLACAIWSSPVNRNFDPDSVLELRRLAISCFCPKNTASNLLGRMVKDIEKRFPKINRLISYQDTETHKGTIYKAANWNAKGFKKFTSWNESRKRSADQSKSNKIRWEYEIKKGRG